MSLAKMIKAAELPITTVHERFLASGDPIYSPAALEFAARQLSRDVGGQRKGRTRRFRASGSGSCLRARMFSRLGVPEARTVDTRLQNIFTNGNFTHLRWQMAGLTAGWLLEAEVPADSEHVGVTLDGVLSDGSIFELKSINTRGFRMVQEYGADHKHLMQIHTCFAITGLEEASLVYEDKNTQDWMEIRVTQDPEVAADVQRELDALVAGWERESLPPMKPKCVEKDGSEYRNCPFREVCPTIKDFTAAKRRT